MEHLNSLFGHGYEYTLAMKDLLDLYIKELYAADKQFNLTGLTTKEEIQEILINGSLRPLGKIIVPRGTMAADMGAGQGIPGIPLSICRPDMCITLLESNEKRISFLTRMKRLLGGSFNVAGGRIEDTAHRDSHRAQYGLVLARAFAPPYIAMECGASLLNENGLIYIYSDDNEGSLPQEVLSHGKVLGLQPLPSEEREKAGFPEYGYCFKKLSPTPDKYPRRFAVMKREAARLNLEG